MRLSPKAGVVLMVSGLFLAGCLENKNPDAVPPEKDDIVDETPDETDGPGDDDGIINSIYADGSPDYAILEAQSTPLTLHRKDRAITGSQINFTEKTLQSPNDSWATPEPAILPFYIAMAGSTPSFIEINPEIYALDTANNTLAIENTSFFADLTHVETDIVGLSIADYVQNTIGFNTLAENIDPTGLFENGTISAMEQATLRSAVDIYYAGRQDANGDCLTLTGQPTMESVSSTGNCNFVANYDSLNARTSISDLISPDINNGPVLLPTSLYGSEFRLVSDTQDDSAGNIYSLSNAENIGRFQKGFLDNNAVIYELIFTDYESLKYAWSEDIPWDSIDRFFLVEDNQVVRMGLTIAEGATLKEQNWIVNQNGLESIVNHISWP